MNNEARKWLIEIAAEGDRELLGDARRLKSLLLDRCGEHRMEINLLTMAQQEGIVEGMSNPGAASNVLQVWKRTLQNNLGMTEEAAEWTADSWALALGMPIPSAAAGPAPSGEPQAAAGSAAAAALTAQPAAASAAAPAAGTGGAPFVSRRTGFIAAAAAAVIAAAIVVWLLVGGQSGGEERQEATNLPAPPATAVATAAAPAPSAAAAAPPKFTAADLKGIHPDRTYLDGQIVAFDDSAFELVLAGTPGDEVGDGAGEVFVSALKYDAAGLSWKEFWSSEALTSDYEPAPDGDYAMTGKLRILHPQDAKLAAAVFDILTSGSSGMNAIYALTIDDQGRVQWQRGLDGDGETVDNGLLPEAQEDNAIVTDSWDGGQLRLTIEGDRLVSVRKPRSDVYPPDAIQVPIQAGDDGLVRVVGGDKRSMKVGDTFVFAPADARTKALFDDKLDIYTDPTMANFSLQRHSYDTLDEAGTKQYFLNGDGLPTLTVEVASASGTAAQSAAYSAADERAVPDDAAAAAPSPSAEALVRPGNDTVGADANPVSAEPSPSASPSSASAPTPAFASASPEASETKLAPDDLKQLDAKLRAAIDKSPCCVLRDADRQKMVDLLRQGADPNYPDKNGWTPLHLAVASSKAQIAQLLIDHGADVRQRTADGETAINFTEDIWTIKVLVAAGANINAANTYGMTVLDHLLLSDRTDDIKELLALGADPNVSSDDFTPLMGASDNPAILKLLLEAGADANKATEDGRTALMMAAIRGDSNLEAVKLLLAHGADAGRRDKHGKTALDLAREQGNAQQIVSLLESYNDSST